MIVNTIKSRRSHIFVLIKLIYIGEIQIYISIQYGYEYKRTIPREEYFEDSV